VGVHRRSSADLGYTFDVAKVVNTILSAIKVMQGGASKKGEEKQEVSRVVLLLGGFANISIRIFFKKIL
jgi:hypothetical protein